ncbi:hypothetical protein KAR91_05275 [Candidatus Pacearchaeota archaeon]|nr:hypothetical protein [Candidatus Pacearchaeota archaeon]
MAHGRLTDEQRLEKQKLAKAKALGQKTTPTKKKSKTKADKASEKAIKELDNGSES